MADEKKTKLSIVIRTVDAATAKIKAINDRLDKITKPARDFREALADLREKSGLDGVIGGLKDVGSAITGVLAKVGMIGGVVGVAVAGLKSFIDEFDDLGDKAERLGVGVDFLAQMRYAAKRSGTEVENLDQGFENLSKSIGEMRAGGGKMAKFLGTVSPPLLKQLKATKGNEEAFLLLADAMAKIKDPAKRAAFASKTLGDASLAPLLAKGAKGIQELRDRYAELAGSQESAVGAAGEFGDSMDDLKASTDGIKAALVTGLAPALTVIVNKLREWFTAHRADIAAWAKDIGERLPGAIKEVVAWLGKAWEKVTAFIDAIGGLKNAAIGVGLIMAGPLIGSIVSLGGALLTALSRAIQLGKALRGLPTNIPNVPSAGTAASQAAQNAAGLSGTKKMGIGGVLATAAPWALLGMGIRDGLDAAGANREGFMSRWQRLQDQMSGPSATDVMLQSFRNTLAAGQEAKITVDFANAPRGTRVSTDPKSTADVETNVGYQMGNAL